MRMRVGLPMLNIGASHDKTHWYCLSAVLGAVLLNPTWGWPSHCLLRGLHNLLFALRRRPSASRRPPERHLRRRVRRRRRRAPAAPEVLAQQEGGPEGGAQDPQGPLHAQAVPHRHGAAAAGRRGGGGRGDGHRGGEGRQADCLQPRDGHYPSGGQGERLLLFGDIVWLIFLTLIDFLDSCQSILMSLYIYSVYSHSS